MQQAAAHLIATILCLFRVAIIELIEWLNNHLRDLAALNGTHKNRNQNKSFRLKCHESLVVRQLSVAFIIDHNVYPTQFCT